MCLLIVQQKNSIVSDDKFKNAWNRNNDGVGYAFIKNNELTVKKYLKLKPFLQSIKSDVKRYGEQSPFLIHFRYTTHGLTNLDNCHPFKIDDGTVFGHNGCINGVDDDDKKSDTVIFNEQILKNLPTDWLQNNATKLLVSDFIGSSKLAFLHVDGTFDIINEKFGHWNKTKTIWFSNDGYKKPTKFRRLPVGNYVNYQWNTGQSFAKPLSTKTKPKAQKVLANNTFLNCEWCQVKTDILNVHEETETSKVEICNTCFNLANDDKQQQDTLDFTF